MPSRNGRHGKLFTWEGTVNILNEKYQTDERPISESCSCPVCRNYSRAYLRHLFKADEVLALRLAVLHNLYFYNELMVKIRAALDEGTFADFRPGTAERWKSGRKPAFSGGAGRSCAGLRQIKSNTRLFRKTPFHGAHRRGRVFFTSERRGGRAAFPT